MENDNSFQQSLANQSQNVQLIAQSIEKSKLELSKIRNQWEFAKIRCNEKKIELQNLRLRELELKKVVYEQHQREDTLKAQCEKISHEIEHVQYEKSLAALKRDKESINRQFYENAMMNYKANIPSFLDVHEYFFTNEVKKEIQTLEFRIAALKKLIKEEAAKSLESDERDILQHIQKHPSQKLKMLKQSEQKIEIIIRNRTKQMRHDSFHYELI